MTTKNFVVKNGLATGNIILDASSSNITANVVVANLSVPSSANLGAVGNIIITGGTANYVLSTNGSGNLSWVAQSGGGGTASYASITIDNFTGNGVQTDFTLSVTPSSEADITVNYNGALQLHSAYTLSGNTLTLSEAPSNGSYLEVTSITGLTAANNASFTTRTYTGDGTETEFTVTNGTTVSSVLVTENGVLQVPTTDYTISSTTLTFTTAPASGVNIQIRELSVVSASSSGTSTSLDAAVANVHITGGTSGQALITDGAGNLSFGTAGVPLGKTVALNMFLGF